MLQHVRGLLTHPHQQWHRIRYHIADSTAETVVGYLLLIAAIAPLSLVIGTTLWGWQSFDGTLVQIDITDALPLGIILYLLLLSCVVGIAAVMYILEHFAGGNADFERCLVFATLTAFPLFLSGLVGLIPVLWLNISLVILAGLYSAHLLIIGMPIFLNMASEQRPILASIILLAGFALLGLSSMIMMSFWQML